MRFVEEFISRESSGGILLILATLLALALRNSPVSEWYTAFLHVPAGVRFGALHIDKTFYHWINDGLMAIFFLLIGLEVKREVIEGQLSSLAQAALPVIAALGGMVVPALVYVAFNQGQAVALQGWAIPMATDIAFALGIFSLLGSRVPVSLKVFLMALAIIDDLGAIIIIALFYTEDLSVLSLGIAGLSVAALVALNRFGVARKAAYFIVGIVLWVSVLKSGVHTTLAGVILAFTIPLSATGEDGKSFSPLREIEHDLHYWVAFFILPLFAFVNAGVDLGRVSFSHMFTGVPLGILFGLFIGKQVGVFGFSWLAIRLNWATLPEGSGWLTFYGACVLTGIGFTMSLFIDSLAFGEELAFQAASKLAILVASCLAGVLGYAIIRVGNRP